MMKKKYQNSKFTVEQIIRFRRNAILNRREWQKLALRIVSLGLVFYILFSKIFVICQLNGNAMFPSLRDGDFVLGFRLEDEINKDDLVLYEMDRENCVSRVVAKATDYVDMDEEGHLYVNGTIQSSDILYPTEPKELLKYPFRVPEGYFFVLGDYRTKASDSRDFGPLPKEAIKGKVITIVRRRGF